MSKKKKTGAPRPAGARLGGKRNHCQTAIQAVGHSYSCLGRQSVSLLLRVRGGFVLPLSLAGVSVGGSIALGEMLSQKKAAREPTPEGATLGRNETSPRHPARPSVNHSVAQAVSQSAGQSAIHPSTHSSARRDSQSEKKGPEQVLAANASWRLSMCAIYILAIGIPGPPPPPPPPQRYAKRSALPPMRRFRVLALFRCFPASGDPAFAGPGFKKGGPASVSIF